MEGAAWESGNPHVDTAWLFLPWAAWGMLLSFSETRLPHLQTGISVMLPQRLGGWKEVIKRTRPPSGRWHGLGGVSGVKVHSLTERTGK